MNSNPSRRQCRHCRKLFSPDHRNRYHQCYCLMPDCRRTSKAASQRRWLRKVANWDYFRGPEQTLHVQQWRKAHPGYQKKRPPASHSSQPSNSQGLKPEKTSCNAWNSHLGALQEVCLSQNPVFIGLLSVLTSSALQEDIATTIGELLFRGEKILGLEPPDQHHPKPHSDYDYQKFSSSRSSAANPQQLWFGRQQPIKRDDDDFRQLILPGFILHD